MFLKKLELFGFKSFPHKTTLLFEPGITAVVGPNGCGKSNISDAIKWVLGEQSPKQMRGARMGDVLFNGTATMKPYNIAEVSITFDNELRKLPIEYNEVTVTRRIVRTGESEYFINKTSTRLKDVHQLFLGTGVGTSAYSVIEQGRIGQIINMKSEDRRYIFEEAAGITKYKAHKKEAFRKLKATEQNLLRVADVTAEIKRQLSAITRQVNKARRYKDILASLKELECRVFYVEMTALLSELETIVSERDDLRLVEETMLSSMTLAEARIEEIRHQLLILTEDVQTSNNQFVELDKQISLGESEVVFNQDRIKEIQDQLRHLLARDQESEDKMTLLEGQIQKTQDALDAVMARKSYEETLLAEQELTQQQREAMCQQKERLLNEKNSALLEISHSMARQNSEIEALRTSVGHMKERQAKIAADRDEIVQKKEGMQEHRAAKKTGLEELKTQIHSLEDQCLTETCDIEANASYMHETRRSLDDMVKEREVAQSRLEMLLELKRTHQGYVDGVKAALTYAEDIHHKIVGIQGPLVNLMTFDEKFSCAIEAALRNHLQAIVVEDASVVRQIVDYLHREQKGNARFLHCEAKGVPSQALGDAFADHPQVYGSAIDLVHFETRYQGLFSSLLHDTLVVEDYETALFVFEKSEWFQRIVTLRGECFDARGQSIWGGSPDPKSKDLLMRDTEISQWQSRIDDHRVREEELKTRLNSIRTTLEGKEQSKYALDDTIRLAKSEFSDFEKEYSRLDWEYKQLEEEIFISDATSQDLNKNLHDDVVTLSEKETHRLSLQEQERGLSKDVCDLREEQTCLRAESEQSRSLIGDLRVVIASLHEKILAEEEQRTRLSTQLDEERKEREQCLEQIHVLREREKQLGFETEQLQGRLANARVECENIKVLLDEMNAKRDQIEGALDNDMTGLKLAQQDLRKKQERINALEVKQTELRMTKNNREEQMMGSYQIRYENIDDAYKVDVMDDAWRAEIQEQRQKLEAIGPVNLGAIEENEELENRYAFLVEQQEDLMQAKDSLQKVIRKINATTKKQFVQTFEAVQNFFTEYYRILFNGGHAELLLVDEENVLESGVDIIARPPGKKLQNINLLSGGEKALTAMALLFALFKVKPSPFCLLDEIDAPLDDPNIQRFLTLLSEFIGETQFLIISHNKKTISVADTLYGITMEQPGISRLISVRLVDKETSHVGALSA